MPGGDGTGPTGAGPMTGRAAGYCAGNDVPGYANPNSGRGRGRGRGWGRGGGGWGNRWRYGWGRGRSGGWGFRNRYDEAEITPMQEAEMLKGQAKAMQDEINRINERIKELESAQKKNK